MIFMHYKIQDIMDKIKNKKNDQFKIIMMNFIRKNMNKLQKEVKYGKINMLI